MIQTSTVLGGPTSVSDVCSLQPMLEIQVLPWSRRWEWQPLPGWNFALWSFHV